MEKTGISDDIARLNAEIKSSIRMFKASYLKSLLLCWNLAYSKYTKSHSASIIYSNSVQINVAGRKTSAKHWIDKLFSDVERELESGNLATAATSTASAITIARNLVEALTDDQVRSWNDFISLLSILFENFEDQPYFIAPGDINQKKRTQDEVNKAFTDVIEPVANKNRVAILLAIHNGSNRFSDLEEKLDLQAGHLLYHLNPLKKSGLLVQDEKKNYSISDRGIAVLNAIFNLQKSSKE